MRQLWFKRIYQAPILDGTKTHTIRNKEFGFRLPERVAAAVGPRRPFAVLMVTAEERVTLDEIEDRATYEALYPGVVEFTRVDFVVVEDLSAVNP